MQLNATPFDLAARYAARALGGADGQAASSVDRGAGFASLLRQSQSVVATPPTPVAPPTPQPQSPVSAPAAARVPTAASTSAAPKDAEEAAPDAPAPAADPTDAPASSAAGEPPALPAAPADAARTLLRAKLRAVDGGGAAKAARTPKADATDADKPAATDKTKAADTTDAAASAATAGALPVASPVPLPLPAAAPRPDDRASDSDGHSAADPARAAPPLAEALAARQGASTPDAMSAPTADPQPAIAAGAGFAAVLAETRSDAAAAPSRNDAVDAVGTAAPTAGAFGPAAAGSTASPQPVDVPTPVASPDFAQHLGVQVTVLAKEGVQHAELHLNPADMGPVSVQITLDGTQARIDFGVDVAATRHAIEAGLPQLAGALADAGFTLAGGGVSQHAGGGAGNDASPRGDGRQGSGGSGETEVAATRAPARSVRIGGLDLYA